MALLANKFRVRSHDPSPLAQAAMLVVADAAVYNPPYASASDSGTPKPGVLFPGAIVVLNASGKAALADNDDALTDAPALLFTAADGDQDYDGAFTGKVTLLQGGMELELDPDNYVAAAYTPNQKLTCGHAGGTSTGKFRAAASGEQIYAIVGPAGLDAATSILHVIVPAGICPAAP